MNKLRPYQQEPADRLEAILRAGPAGDLSDCGTGKTFVGCEMIRRLDEPTLVVCPKISITNWKRAGEFMGTEFDVLNYDKVRTGRTPYGRWEKAGRGKRFIWAKEVKRIVFDECFPPNTLVSTPTGATPIYALEPGDLVTTDVGPREVVRKIANVSESGFTLLTIVHQYGTLQCTPNHKLYTQRGWVCAKDLQALRDTLFDAGPPAEVLLHPEVRRYGSLGGPGTSSETGRTHEDAGTDPGDFSGGRPASYDPAESGKPTRHSGTHISGSPGQTFPNGARRERAWINRPTEGAGWYSGQRVGAGERPDRISTSSVAGRDAIRFSQLAVEGGGRVRRELSPNGGVPAAGREEGGACGESRVGGVAISERGDSDEPRTDRLRNSAVLRIETSPRRVTEVFDLEVAGAHRYFAGGVLVSNCHRCSALDSLQSILLRDAVSQGKKPLMITGSVAESPLQLKSIGYALGLHDNTNFWWWAQQHGCFKPPFGGLKFTTNAEKAASIMAELHSRILPDKAIRIRVSDLGDYYKGYVLDCPLIDVPNPEEVDQLNAEVAAALEDLEKRIEERGSSEEHPMTKLLRARQRLDLLKIPAKVELARDLLDSGHTVFLFENFSESIDQLRLKFPEAGVIVGDTPQEERQRVMDAVQSDDLRIVLLNQQAGGESISLHNITGKHRRASIVSHQHSAKTLRQVIFRAARSGATESALVLMPLVAGTVEEGIKKNVERKSLCLDLLQDGDLTGRA